MVLAMYVQFLFYLKLAFFRYLLPLIICAR